MDNKSLHTDRELFRLISEGDELAFRRLFDAYSKQLYPFIFGFVKSSSLAEEFMQETMLRVWYNRDKLAEIEHPGAWIFRISSNLALSYLKRKLTEEKVTEALKDAPFTTSHTAEDALSVKKLTECVKAAVEQLPAKRKLIYQLSRQEGLTRAEIAARLGISEKTVKNSLHAALQFIRSYLQKEGYLVSMFYFLLALHF